ncbi:MAG: hypothetical protein LBS51_07065 [Oscillospiraceae bacterium]|jgi:phenylpyruvate tautomerase PptA (4-oxalocrotonate tautomerase family)|nr:hypothetical protein [Oscillospiraceae bacterium]
MPYVKVRTSKTLTPEQHSELNSGLGISLETIPGKDRSMLILDLEEGRTFFYSGKKQDNFAFVEVHYFGNFSYHVKQELTESVFGVLANVLGTTPETATLSITEHTTWGCFGKFIDMYYPEN